MLETRNVSLEYISARQRVVGLASTSLSIARGERVALMGRSGSGKSTLLSILGGITKPTSGEYLFEGRPLQDLTMRELGELRGRRIGFVFQNFCLLPHLTLLENVLVPVQHLRSDRRADQARAEQLLAQVGIADLRHRLPVQVSGGQAQRAAIARALMRDPALILADEPTGSLDQQSSAEVLRLLNSLNEGGKTLVVATHDTDVARKLGRIISIERVAAGSVAPELVA